MPFCKPQPFQTVVWCRHCLQRHMWMQWHNVSGPSQGQNAHLRNLTTRIAHPPFNRRSSGQTDHRTPCQVCQAEFLSHAHFQHAPLVSPQARRSRWSFTCAVGRSDGGLTDIRHCGILCSPGACSIGRWSPPSCISTENTVRVAIAEFGHLVDDTWARHAAVGGVVRRSWDRKHRIGLKVIQHTSSVDHFVRAPCVHDDPLVQLRKIL